MTLPRISVVIATFNRPEGVRQLLADLSAQSLPSDAFEVVVVDDGSAVPLESVRASLRPAPRWLTLLTQTNGGPSLARDAGIRQARASLIVSLDDDMRVHPDFLASHLASHDGDTRRVVLGPLRVPTNARLPLFEQFHVASIERRAAQFRAGHPLTGSALYSGNVSFRRADYLDVGGFDPSFRLSEDAELGIRFALAGIPLVIADEAWATHDSDHASESAWLRRTRAYGGADTRVSEKHPTLVEANPWRFLFDVSRVSRPLMLCSTLAPAFGALVARLAMSVSGVVNALGAHRVAIAGTTFAYGAQYFAGVGAHYGSRRATMRGLRHYLNLASPRSLGVIGRFAKCWADIRADHVALVAADDKYQSDTRRRSSLIADAARRIGFQMMVAYRCMRLARALRLTPLAMLVSRSMRHLYGADIHWDAELAPGVVLVHGLGLVISGEARVGPGCILFQHVTLGVSMHPTNGTSGAPVLEANVHVGPGAALLGPIRVGRGTKIVANSVLMESAEAGSIVGPAPTVVRARSAKTSNT